MLSNIYSMYKVENMEYIINNNFQQPNKRGETMKKKIYGDTEIFSYSACHECIHCKENEEGMFFCKYNPEELFEDDEDDSLPAIHIAIHHGTYGKTTTTNCDCEDFDQGE